MVMRRLSLLPLLGSLLLAGSGCGTVLNFFNGESAGEKRAYGGVRIDCQVAAEQFKDHRVDGPPLVLWALFDRTRPADHVLDWLSKLVARPSSREEPPCPRPRPDRADDPTLPPASFGSSASNASATAA
jgi:hypothetical protein